MAGMRDLLRRRVFNSLINADLHRSVRALRCVSSCVLEGRSVNHEIRHHKSTTSFRNFSTTESSALDGDLEEILSSVRRIVPKTKEERLELKHQPYKAPADARILKVSILGAPNSGKSTLTNALMRWRICSVSKKVHTTKHNTKALLMEGNTQIVFVDTPGLISAVEKKRHNLEPTMLKDPENSAKNADLILVLVDVSNKYTRHSLDYKVLKILDESKNKKTVLVLNKVDLVKCKQTMLGIVRELTDGSVDGQSTHTTKKAEKPKTLAQIFEQTERALKELDQNTRVSEEAVQEAPNPTSSDEQMQRNSGPGWPHFNRIFMVSALNEDGLEDLRDYLFRKAKLGPWVHNPNFVTDQSPEEIAILAVREKLLDHLPKEIPYNLNLEIEHWEVDAYGVLRISMLVKCPEKHQVKLIIGGQGAIVSKIAAEARQMLMNTFRCEVSLKLIVSHFTSRKK